MMATFQVGDDTPPLPCARCGQPQRHEVLAIHSTTGPICKCHPYERFEDDDMVGRCRGCGTIAFFNHHHSSMDASAGGLDAVWHGTRDAWRFEIWGGEGDYADSTGAATRPTTRFLIWDAGNESPSDVLLRRIGRHRPDVVIVKGGENVETQPLPAGLWDMGLAWQHTLVASDRQFVRVAANTFIDDVPPRHCLESEPPDHLDVRINGLDVVIGLGAWKPVADAAIAHQADPALVVPMVGRAAAAVPLADAGFTAHQGTLVSPSLSLRVLDAYASPAEAADGVSPHSPIIIDIQG